MFFIGNNKSCVLGHGGKNYEKFMELCEILEISPFTM